MSWRSTGDLYRMPITVDHTGAAAGAFDATYALPTALANFWDTVQSTGNDIRVTRGDGITSVTKFDLDSFNTTTKSGTLEISDTAAAQSSLLYWIYWGDTSLSSGVTSFVPAGPKSAYIDNGTTIPTFTVDVPQQERLGQTDPIAQFAKDPDATVNLWFRFGQVMQRREVPVNGSYEFESLTYASVSAAAGLTATATATRFEVAAVGGLAVRVRLSGGTTANDYIVTVTAGTSEGRVLTARAKIQVRAMA